MLNEENQDKIVQTSPIGEKVESSIQAPEIEEEPAEEARPKRLTENENGISWKEIETKTAQTYSNKPKSELSGETKEAPKKPLLSGKGYANLGILLAVLCFLPGPDLIPFILGPLGVICGMVAYAKNEQARAILAVVLSITFSIISIFFLEAILAVF